MSLQCTYFPELDRFAVSTMTHAVDKSHFTQSEGYTSLEYLRYVPLDGITLHDVDEYLLKYPQELCCEVTNVCNAHCRVCIADAPTDSPRLMSSELLTTTIKDLQCPVARITITGGEPTTHPELQGIVAGCVATAGRIVLSTNGYQTQVLRDILESCCSVLLAISLHGPKDVHDAFVECPGSYVRAMETIRMASQRSMPIQVVSIAACETVSTLPELSQALSEFAISEHRINLVKPQGRCLTRAVTYEHVLESLFNIELSHKVSIKKRDQPFLFLDCLGNLEVRHGRAY